MDAKPWREGLAREYRKRGRNEFSGSQVAVPLTFAGLRESFERERLTCFGRAGAFCAMAGCAIALLAPSNAAGLYTITEAPSHVPPSVVLYRVGVGVVPGLTVGSGVGWAIQLWRVWRAARRIPDGVAGWTPRGWVTPPATPSQGGTARNT